MNCESSSTLLCRRRLSPFTAAFAFTFLLLITGIYSTEGNGKGEKRNTIWNEKCSKSDIAISQSATGPLPNGIPTYTVEISNTCISGCNISNIHIRCGCFSSARLVNPRVFKRLRFNDCLLNDGKPLRKGRTLSFMYANTFRYPLSISFVTCS